MVAMGWRSFEWRAKDHACERTFSCGVLACVLVCKGMFTCVREAISVGILVVARVCVCVCVCVRGGGKI